ncbi:MAG TPA: PEP-CTERM sorting domain-containing protein, partial [Gemmatales bacterium]|nr:PEP-CTERM sorting domain-containing protein [Gemmatales bacterium]
VLVENININLAAGTYFLEVSSAGGKFGSLGPNNNWDPSYYFDMGSYFLTGVIPVPEPATIALFGISGLAVGIVLYRRRKVRRALVDQEVGLED